jgi:hypothetical protein
VSSTGNELNAPWAQRLFIEPPKPDGRHGIESSRITHVITQGAIEPAEARELASVLRELADDCERVDAEAIPHLEAYLRAVANPTYTI